MVARFDVGLIKNVDNTAVRLSTNYGGSNHAAQVTLQMASPKTSTNWDTKTEVSSKYRKVEVDELLRKITSLQ